MTKPLCIYHGNCADGFTAAWIVKRALGDVDFHPGVYQQQPPDVEGRDVLMVDFSYKRPVIEEMRRSAKSILILDHHKTAQADLVGMLPPFGGAGWERHLTNVYQDICEGVSCSPYVLFDMDRSGAQITWDFFFHGESRPMLVNYVGDRDLWKFLLPLSREVNAFVFAYEYEFRNWDFLHAQLRDHMDIQRVAEMGGAIEKKHHKDVTELVGVTKRRMVIGGVSVPVANLPYTLTSDAGHLMAQNEPFAACYWDTAEGRIFSLRSTDTGQDVSEVAKAYGGGGHRNASGFKMPIGWEGDNNGFDYAALQQLRKASP